MDEKDFENKFLNSGIGNLAKEISEEINPADLEGLNNPEDLFSSFPYKSKYAFSIIFIMQE